MHGFRCTSRQELLATPTLSVVAARRAHSKQEHLWAGARPPSLFSGAPCAQPARVRELARSCATQDGAPVGLRLLTASGAARSLYLRCAGMIQPCTVAADHQPCGALSRTLLVGTTDKPCLLPWRVKSVRALVCSRLEAGLVPKQQL